MGNVKGTKVVLQVGEPIMALIMVCYIYNKLTNTQKLFL